MRLGIVDSRYEITYSSSLDTALDDLPRGHEVAQGDDTEVVANGSTQQRGCLLESRDAREG